GVALAIDQANAQRLVIGGRPVRFRLLSEDDQGDPKIGTTVAQKLVDAHVSAVIGHLNSGVTIPASEIYNKAGIPVISGSATNPMLTERGLKRIPTRIKARNPDAVFHGGMDATGGLMLKQARELGLKAAFAFGDGACTDEMASLAGPAGEGLACSQAGLPAASATKAFRDAFIPRYGETKLYAPFFYDATNVVIDAMKRADST